MKQLLWYISSSHPTHSVDCGEQQDIDALRLLATPERLHHLAEVVQHGKARAHAHAQRAPQNPEIQCHLHAIQGCKIHCHLHIQIHIPRKAASKGFEMAEPGCYRTGMHVRQVMASKESALQCCKPVA